jgi:hypothetical protein
MWCLNIALLWARAFPSRQPQQNGPIEKGYCGAARNSRCESVEAGILGRERVRGKPYQLQRKDA